MAKDSPIQFKGTSLQIIHAALRTTEIASLRAALEEMTGNAPDFFENEPALLDFSAAEDLPATADWPAIRALFAGSGLHAVATLGLPPELAASAQEAGLPAVKNEALGRLARPVKPVEAAPAPVETPAPVEEAAIAAAPEPAMQEMPVTTITVDKPLRSGQRVYARGGDLVVLAMVSAGAEVIADGNIHIYAPLRGRALAGASGDRKARIFTTCLEAELVSVAGFYRTFESGVPAALARQPAIVGLIEGDGEPRLDVAALALR